MNVDWYQGYHRAASVLFYQSFVSFYGRTRWSGSYRDNKMSQKPTSPSPTTVYLPKGVAEAPSGFLLDHGIWETITCLSRAIRTRDASVEASVIVCCLGPARADIADVTVSAVLQDGHPSNQKHKIIVRRIYSGIVGVIHYRAVPSSQKDARSSRTFFQEMTFTLYDIS